MQTRSNFFYNQCYNCELLFLLLTHSAAEFTQHGVRVGRGGVGEATYDENVC